MKIALGPEFKPELRALTEEELFHRYQRLNREGHLCLDAAGAAKVNQANILDWSWWSGRAAGLLDAMMILDGTWDGIDIGFEAWSRRGRSDRGGATE